MTREEALKMVKVNIRNANLVKHALAVEAVDAGTGKEVWRIGKSEVWLG